MQKPSDRETAKPKMHESSDVLSDVPSEYILTGPKTCLDVRKFETLGFLCRIA